MDSYDIFWGAILLTLQVLFFGIPFLTYVIFSKLGRPKLGRIVGWGLLSFFILATTYFVFEDYFFFKFSARSELKEMDVVLNDDFDILRNESGGLRDYYQEFELRISDQDAKRLAGQVRLDSNIRVKRKELDINVWKEVRVNPKTNILVYEYIIN